MGIFHANCSQLVRFGFLYSQQDEAALGVGKGGICLPNALWQTALGAFGFYPVILGIAGQIMYVYCLILHSFSIAFASYTVQI
jgi:hypothetical protein